MPDDQPAQPHPVPILRAQRVYLRPAERSDLPTFVAYRSDPAVARYQSWAINLWPLSQAPEQIGDEHRKQMEDGKHRI